MACIHLLVDISIESYMVFQILMHLLSKVFFYMATEMYMLSPISQPKKAINMKDFYSISNLIIYITE